MTTSAATTAAGRINTRTKIVCTDVAEFCLSVTAMSNRGLGARAKGPGKAIAAFARA
jgi:hypothetical protein